MWGGGWRAGNLEKIPQMRKLYLMYHYRGKRGSCQGSNCVRTYESMHIHTCASFYVCTVCVYSHAHMYCELHKA
jgi:hypothetical protein